MFKTSKTSKSKSESGEKVEDLTKLPKYMLLEMLDRQQKLLSNRVALEKLPDKGLKVKQIKSLIENELDKRNSSSDICDSMAVLSLSVDQVNALEWTKNTENLKVKKNEGPTDSDTNPLKILASHSGTALSREVIRKEEQRDSLISENDLEEIYASKLCSRIDNVEPTTRFLPHKTLNHAYSCKKTPTEFKPENLCSAAEPPSKFGSVKVISLESSIRLQFEQAQHLKEVQLKNAAERLKDKTYSIGNVLPPKEKLGTFRDHDSCDSESEEDEIIQEIEDDCAGEDREGTVSYQITD